MLKFNYNFKSLYFFKVFFESNQINKRVYFIVFYFLPSIYFKLFQNKLQELNIREVILKYKQTKFIAS